MPTNLLRQIPPSFRRALLFLGFATAALTASEVNAQNLITNGDFEIGPYFQRGLIGGWAVGGPGFIMVQNSEGVTSGSFAATLDEGSNSQGNTLSQTIATTPGQTYILEFDGGA